MTQGALKVLDQALTPHKSKHLTAQSPIGSPLEQILFYPVPLFGLWWASGQAGSESWSSLADRRLAELLGLYQDDSHDRAKW